MDVAPSDTNTPAFNSGLGIIERINKIRNLLNGFVIADDWDNWCDCIRCWYYEIAFKLNDEERKIVETELNKAMSLRGKRDQILLKTLHHMSLYLGMLQHKYKLGMPEQDGEFKIDEVV